MRPKILSISLFLVLATWQVAGQTDLSGTITADSTLVKSKSPYSLKGSLTVRNNAKLTIESGCQINLGNYNILIGSSSPGNLMANNVTFSTTASTEKYIIFQDGGQGTIDGCHFTKVYINVDDDAGASLTFTGNSFSLVKFPFRISPNTSPMITGNSSNVELIGLQGTVKQTKTLRRYSWNYEMTGTVNIQANAILTVAEDAVIDLKNYMINVGYTTPGTLQATRASFKSTNSYKARIIFRDGGKGTLTGNSFSNVYLSVESDASDEITVTGNSFTNIDFPIRLDANRIPAISGNVCQVPKISLGGTVVNDITLRKYDWDYILWANVNVTKSKTLSIGSGIVIDLYRYFIAAGYITAGRLSVSGATMSSSYSAGGYLYFRDGGTGSIGGCVFDKAFVAVEDNAGNDITITNNDFKNVVFPVELSANRAPVISGNTGTGMVIGLTGNVTAGNTLPRYQWDYRLSENIIIKNNAILTLADSVRIDLDTKYINVGTGTSSPGFLEGKKVLFKGRPIDRGRIQFYPGAGGDLEHCSFEQSYIRIDNCSPTFSYCRFYRCGTAIEIRNAANPLLRFNDFYNNETAISHIGTISVDASESFWGHPSGPQHTGNPAGVGEVIAGTILYTPFRVLPNTGSTDGMVTPVSFSFGTIATGTRIDTSFTLMNGGDIDLLVTAVHHNTSNLSLQCPDRFWLFPDSAMVVPFSFTSLSGSAEKDTITFENGDSVHPQMKVTVSSMGVIEKMNINFNKLEIDSFPRVKCYFTVTDQANIPVGGITKECLSLKEDGKVIPDFDFIVRSEVSDHVSAVLVIDQSGSMSGQKLRDAKSASTGFVNEMSATDRGCIISFNDRVYIRKVFTSDKAELIKGIQNSSAMGETALFNAIAQAIDSVRNQPGNKAIIALTDGQDNRSTVTPEVIVTMALQYGVSVYTIGLGEDAEESTIRYISSLTGGDYYYAPSSEVLSIIYKRISGQLQNQYLITYDAPENNPFPRTLQLTVNCPGPAVTDSIRYTTERQTIEFLAGTKPFHLSEFRRNSRSYFYFKTAGSDNILGMNEELMFIRKSGTAYIPFGGKYLGDSIFQFWVDISEDLTRPQLEISLPDSIIHNGSWIRFLNKPAPVTVPLLKFTHSQAIDLFAGGTLGVRLLAGAAGAGPSVAAASLSARGGGGMGLEFAMDEGGDEYVTRRLEAKIGLEAESPEINAVAGDIQAGAEAGLLVSGIIGQTMRFPPVLDNDAIKAKTLFLLETFSLGGLSLSPDFSLLKMALKQSLSLLDDGLAGAYDEHFHSNMYGLGIEGEASIGASVASGSGSDQNKLKLADAGGKVVFSGQFLDYPQTGNKSINFGYALELGFSVLSLDIMGVDVGMLTGYTGGVDFNLGANFTPVDKFHSLDFTVGLMEQTTIVFGQQEKRRELGFNVPKKVIARALNSDNIIRSVAPFLDRQAPKMDFQIGKDYFLNSISHMFNYATGTLDDINDHIVIETSEATTNSVEFDATVKIDAALIIGGGLELGVTLSTSDEISALSKQHTIVDGKLIPLATYQASAGEELISLKEEVLFLMNNAPKLVADLINALINKIKEAIEAGKDFFMEGIDGACTFGGNIASGAGTILSNGWGEIVSYSPDIPFLSSLKNSFLEPEVIHGYVSDRVVRGHGGQLSSPEGGTLCLVSNCYRVNVYNDNDSIIPEFDPCLLTIAIQPSKLATFGFGEDEKNRARIFYYNFSTLNWEEIAGDQHEHPDTVAAMIGRSGTYGVGILFSPDDDKEAPVIPDHYPMNGGTYHTDSLLWAKLVEPPLGVGVDLAASSLTIDGKEADALWNPVNSILSIKPAIPLSLGNHTLKITATDFNGNTVMKEVHFTVTKETLIATTKMVEMTIRCYPNPASELMHLEIAGCTGVVESGIYNNLGQKIANLWSGRADGNPITLTWQPVSPDGRIYPSGVYFVKVRCGNEIQVKKIVIR